MTVNDTDLFLVNRSNSSYQLETQNLVAELQDTDLMLVNRGGTSYKATGAEIKDSFIDDLIISQPVLSTNDPEVGQPITAAASASGGKGPYTYAFQWFKRSGDSILIPGATSATYTPVDADLGDPLFCRVTATDAQPESVTGTSNYTNAVIKPAGPPVLASISLADDSPGGDRFTSKSFTTSIVMTDDGIPNSDKELKAQIEGSLTIAGATDEIVGIAAGWNQSQTWSTNVTGSVTTGYEGVNAFNGDTSSAGWLAAVSSTSTWTASYDFTRSVRLYLFSENADQAGAGSVDITVNDNTEAIPNVGGTVGRWVTAFTGSGTLSKIESKMQANINKYVAVRAIEVDGVLLVDPSIPDTSGEKILTLASAVNLENGAFKSGDLVKQDNSPITPVSSAITNVGTGVVSKVRGYYASDRPNNLAEVLQGTEFDLTLKGVNAVENNNYLSLVCESGCPTSGKVFASEGGPIFDMKYSSGGGNFTENGTQLDSASNPPSGPSNTDSIEFSDGGTTGYVVNTQAAYTILKTINLGVVPAINSAAESTENILTLTDASGLSDFEVGDEVTAGSTTGPWTETFRQVLYASEVTPWSDGTATTVSSGDDNISAEAGTQVLMLDRNTLGDGDELTFTRTSGTNEFYIRGSETAEADMAWAASTYPTNFTVTRTTSTGVDIPAEQRYIKMMSTGTADSLLYKVEGTSLGVLASITAITPATPSITTNGGTWNVGEVVTGPEKAITGTFVSADPSVPSMTLSSATSGWSANTGNFAQNTINNPVEIQPLTSPITNVGTGVDYSAYCVGGYNPAYPPSNLFDGDLSTETESLEGETVTFTPPIPITGSTFRINGLKSGDSSSSLKVNGDEFSTLFVGGDWEWITLPGVTKLSSLSYKRGNSPNVIALTAIEVDGALVVSGQPTLTLADDTDLVQFVAGDEVYANTGYTPTSSAITNVAAAPDITSPSFSISGGHQVYGDGPCYGESEPIPANGYGNAINIKQNQGGNISISPAIDGNGSIIEILFYYDGAEGYMEYEDKDGNTVRVDDIQNLYDDAKPGAKWFSTGVTSLKRIISVGMTSGDLGWWGLRCNGASWFNKAGGTVVSSSDKTLTLTDDQDLDVFQVGDAVTGAPITATMSAIDVYGLYYEDESVSTSPLISTAIAAEIGEQNYFNSNINDANKNGNKGFYMFGDDSITIAYSGLSVGDTIGFVAGPASATVESHDLNFTVTGNVNETGVVTFYEGSVLKGDKNDLPKQLTNLTVQGTSGSITLVSALSSGGQNSQFYLQWIEGLAEGVVTITAIDKAAPSITTDGGTWVNGNVVIGPYLPPATGTVGSTDPAGPTMTLSESDGRWVPSTKVTMDPKPAVSVTAYLNFDSNGNVSGYQTADPGFVKMGLGDSKTLTFPATLSSGDAPDTELPEGTSIRTKVNAVNPSGNSTSLWSNRVTPGTTTLNLGMGETVYQTDIFTAGAARIKNYQVRATENECMIAQAAYDAEIADFNARLNEIEETYGS